MNSLHSILAGLKLPTQIAQHARAELDTLAQRAPNLIERLDAHTLAEAFLIALITSDYFAKALQQQPNRLEKLLEGEWLEARHLEPNWLSLKVSQSNTVEQNLKTLRDQRHLHLLRILWRENGGVAHLTDTLTDLSTLAAQQIATAEQMSRAALIAQYSEPDDDHLCILAMGKLGGGELNLSSDVDLVCIHGKEGETRGARRLEHSEFFARQVRGVVDLLSRITADGFCYRTDTRLRPFGKSGRAVVSIDALEHYLSVHGREWERYAYIKTRALTGSQAQHNELHEVLRPFVYRRYLDFGVFESLRDMKAMIEREVRSRELQDNIKRGAGGIREIEFIVQTLQLVYGGKRPALQQNGFYAALDALVQEECLPQAAANELREDYNFLRRLENGVQGIRDQQVHSIPSDPLDQQRLVLLMKTQDWSQLSSQVQHVRDRVHAHFNDLSAAVPSSNNKANGGNARDRSRSLKSTEQVPAALEDEAACAQDWYRHGFSGVLEPLSTLGDGGLRDRLETHGRARLDALMPALTQALLILENPTPAATRLVALIEGIGRRSAYFALLNENPHVLHRVVAICASSAELSLRLARTPVLLDSLVDPRGSSMGLTRNGLRERFARRVESLDRLDEEQGLLLIRDFRQTAMFDVAVADMERQLPVMKISDRLTDIAELILTEAWQQSCAQMQQRFGQPRRADNGACAEFAVLGYGKLGGIELSYHSDLDLVFLYDDGGAGQTDGEKSIDNAMYFARLARRFIHILTVPTAMGAAYEVDMRLRPSGNSGLLISRLSAFSDYQHQQAWTWEHQALLRARAVAGDAPLIAAFEALRVEIIAAARETNVLVEAVTGMRDKMRTQLDRSDAMEFDLKHGSGGLVDIEFLVQFLVLAGAGEDPSLARWSDNVRQLEDLAQSGHLSAEVAEKLTQIYLLYRQKLHAQALSGVGGRILQSEFQAERDWVAALYTRQMTGSDRI